MISGVWLPIVTPFVDGAVDFAGYERLLEHYLGKGVSGVFPLGTTGESPTIDDDEMEALVERTVGVVAGRVPVFVGVGGNATRQVLATRQRPEGFAVMTGDDALFYTMLAHGGDGGILASCHVATEGFVGVHARMAANDHHAARAIWSRLEAVVQLLFKEANPMPIKHCVW